MTDAADRLYERMLVLRCQAGDEAAFAELVDRYQPRLRYYLGKMLRNLHAAEDALQDVWLSAFRALGRLADAAAFRAWLYRIARDRAVRDLIAASRRATLRQINVNLAEICEQLKLLRPTTRSEPGAVGTA